MSPDQLPVTVELCTRIRDGHPCLGRISRTGVPEIVRCESCGRREAGVVYTCQEARAARVGQV